MSWNEERIDALKRLWGAGYSASAIGKMIGVSKNAVVGKAHRLKLPARPSPIKRGEGTTTTRRNGPRRVPSLSAHPKAPSGGSEVRASEPQLAREAPAPAPQERAPVRARKKGATGPQCLWPIGDPGAADFHFCGGEAVPGKPYCAEHCSVAYVTRSRADSEAA